jgi:hypothetical protein
MRNIGPVDAGDAGDTGEGEGEPATSKRRAWEVVAGGCCLRVTRCRVGSIVRGAGGGWSIVVAGSAAAVVSGVTDSIGTVARPGGETSAMAA